MSETKTNYFEKLYNVNVNEHVEKKNGLSYVSWAWAWAEVKKLHPDALYTIYENADGWFYHTDGRTAWVKTGVTVAGIEHIEYLPVMDMRNRSIPVGNVTSFDVNKAIQRSLTKACARHGLGLYIYAGEDLPEAEADQVDLEAERMKKSLAAMEAVDKEKKQKAPEPDAEVVEIPLICECCKNQIQPEKSWTVKQIVDASRKKYDGRLFCYKCVTTHRAEEYITKETTE